MAVESYAVADPANDARRRVSFVLDGRVCEVADAPATMTVLEYLRETLGRTGTKEGCAEGDCGACTVVLGQLAPAGDRIEYRAVNSCIRYLPTIDGYELVTVESLQGEDGSLHPVQQAMVDAHASQCGFCTPGFVMSLFALYLQNSAPQRGEVVDALAGNLCRCTGYRPIIDAGCALPRYPDPPRWSRSDAQSAARVQRLRCLQSDASLHLEGFTAPRSVAELADTLAAEPESLLLAGGTDVGLWTTKHLRELPDIVYVGAVAELKQIRTTPAGLEIGAAVVLTDAWQAILDHYPELEDLARRFASPPVCNSGTLCGNIANGSPVGDSMPALLALGAGLNLRRAAGERRVALEDFYLGYQRTDLRPGELIASVVVPLRRPGRKLASYKLSKRFDQDIAAVCGAFALELDDDRILDARIAYGGMAAIPARARNAERAIIGQMWNEQAVESAAGALARDFQPLSDLRASNDYRALAAANMLRRFHLQTGAARRALRIADVAVSSG